MQASNLERSTCGDFLPQPFVGTTVLARKSVGPGGRRLGTTLNGVWLEL